MPPNSNDVAELARAVAIIAEEPAQSRTLHLLSVPHVCHSILLVLHSRGGSRHIFCHLFFIIVGQDLYIYMSNRKNPGNTKYVFDGHWFMEIDGNC